MARAHDQDPLMDELLSRAVSSAAADRDGDNACVDAETLAAWAERELPATAAAQVETHVSSCARCQAMVAAFVRSAPGPVSSESIWVRWRLRWLVPVMATASALAIYVASRPPEAPLVPAESEVAVIQERPQADAPAVASPSAPQSPAPRERVEQRADAPPSKKSAAASAPPQQNAARDSAVGENLQGLGAQTSAGAAAPMPAQTPATATSETARADVSGPSAPAPAAPRALGGIASRAALSAIAALEVRGASAAERWRVSPSGLVEHTADAGQRWQASMTPVSAGIRAGSSPAAGVCWLVGAGGAVWVSTDALRFVRLPFPIAADLTAVTATSSQSALVTTATGETFRTTNQGATWTRTP